MTIRLSALAVLASCAAAACTPAGPSPAPAPVPATAPSARVPMTQLVRDIHSFARPNEARVTHVELDLTTDFSLKMLGGTATLDVQAAPGAGEIVLDTKNLAISRVTDAAGQPLRFTLG